MICVLLGLTFQPAKANTINYTLGIGNSAISGYTGPYGTVAVNLTDTTHATITFTALTGSGVDFLFAAHGAAAVNVNAASWTLSNIVGVNTYAGFTPGAYSDGGGAQEDGFGHFNQTIDSFDGYTHSATSLSFLLTDTSGAWASAADVLAVNNDGYVVAAHIFVTTDPAMTERDALATGYAGNDPPSVPDGGATAPLLGMAVCGLAMMRRFLK
ncbi:MAG TPA: VPDSG-CTERM sorting domain-containing protein [Verrucomicrobiae bacterium]